MVSEKQNDRCKCPAACLPVDAVVMLLLAFLKYAMHETSHIHVHCRVKITVTIVGEKKKRKKEMTEARVEKPSGPTNSYTMYAKFDRSSPPCGVVHSPIRVVLWIEHLLIISQVNRRAGSALLVDVFGFDLW